MRNAVAQFDDDFELREPARKKAPRRASGGKARKKGATRRWFALFADPSKLARYAAIGMSATISLGIIVNALVLQTARHPAPLFGSSVTLPDRRAPEPPARHAAKAAPTEDRALSNHDAKPDTEVAAQPKASEEKAPAMPPARPHQDEIARLIAGSLPPAADKLDAKTIFNAQKALVTVGFVLKPNGVLGPQTRKAIEIFEKDHSLPVDGELSKRVIRALAAQSKSKIEH